MERVTELPNGGLRFEGEMTWSDFEHVISVFRQKGIAVAVRRVVGWRTHLIDAELDRVAAEQLQEGSQQWKSVVSGRKGTTGGALPAWEH